MRHRPGPGPVSTTPASHPAALLLQDRLTVRPMSLRGPSFGPKQSPLWRILGIAFLSLTASGLAALAQDGLSPKGRASRNDGLCTSRGFGELVVVTGRSLVYNRTRSLFSWTKRGLARRERPNLTNQADPQPSDPPDVPCENSRKQVPVQPSVWMAADHWLCGGAGKTCVGRVWHLAPGDGHLAGRGVRRADHGAAMPTGLPKAGA
jgi:hypothetical protein